MNVKSREETKRDIVDQMFWDPVVDASRVEVEMTDSKIVLKGMVPSYYAKESAWKDAWLVSNGYDIVNNLTIEYPEAIRLLSDEQLEEFVKSALFFSPAFDSTKLDVSVKDRTVRITGTVDSYWQKDRLNAVVSEIKGIHDIDNRVEVVVPEKVPDEKIVADIFYAFLRSVGLDTNHVRVRAVEGKVTLEGHVPDKVTYDAVVKIVVFTRGVTGFDNKMEIR